MSTESLTVLVAAWGALLSTILAIREIWKDRNDRARLNVWINIETSKTDEGNTTSFLTYVVANVGKRPITVLAPGFKAMTQNKPNVISNKEAITLAEGQIGQFRVSVATYPPSEEIEYLFVLDSAHKEHRVSADQTRNIRMKYPWPGIHPAPGESNQ